MKANKTIGVGFGVMMVRDNKVLLGRRHEDPEKADSSLGGAGKWTMPGGKLEFGESFEDGAKREVFEETGMRIRSLEVICINQDMAEGVHFVTIGMYCDDFVGDPKIMEPDEITSWAWFDLANLPSPLYFPTAKILQNYIRQEFFIAGQNN